MQPFGIIFDNYPNKLKTILDFEEKFSKFQPADKIEQKEILDFIYQFSEIYGPSEKDSLTSLIKHIPKSLFFDIVFILR